MSTDTTTQTPPPWYEVAGNHHIRRIPWDDMPARADLTMRNPDKEYRVYSRARFAEAYARTGDPVAALAVATTATIWIRNTEMNCYVVARCGNHNEDPAFWYGIDGSFGADRIAAAAAGIPVAPGVTLTNHCGRDKYLAACKLDGVEPEYPTFREFTVHRGGHLPPDLFILG